MKEEPIKGRKLIILLSLYELREQILTETKETKYCKKIDDIIDLIKKVKIVIPVEPRRRLSK